MTDSNMLHCRAELFSGLDKDFLKIIYLFISITMLGVKSNATLCISLARQMFVSTVYSDFNQQWVWLKLEVSFVLSFFLIRYIAKSSWTPVCAFSTSHSTFISHLLI